VHAAHEALRKVEDKLEDRDKEVNNERKKLQQKVEQELQDVIYCVHVLIIYPQSR
jgi:hypothetical protein